MRHTLLFLLVLFSSFTANAGVVKGVVRDTLGEPVPYAIVAVKNSTYGVNTNLAGGYFLELKPGTYTLVFSQLGYEPQEKRVTVSDNVVVLDVTLRVSPKELGMVEISAKGDRDKGKEIMKNVIKARSEYWDRVENFQCNTYQKSSLEKVLRDSSKVKKATPTDTAAKEIKKKREKKKDLEKEAEEKKELEEEFKGGKLNLIESISVTYFRAPGQYKENVLAYHDFAEKKRYEGTGVSKTVEYGEHEIVPEQYSSDNPYLLVGDAQSVDFNFYRNYIDMPSLSARPLLSPAAATAFLSYRFEYITTFKEGGKTIHKIVVDPLFRSDALFSGFLFIEDSTWAILSVNLSVNRDVLLYCREFSVIQDYSEVAPGIYLPVRREFMYTIREGGFDIIGNARIDHSDYMVNTTFPKNFFGNEIKSYQVDAFDKDSVYWSEHRPIQLSEPEITYIHKVDSLVAWYSSPEYFAESDSIFNHLNVWSFLLNGVGHRNRARGNEFYFDPLIAQAQIFGVGGYRHRLGAYYNHDFRNGMLLETEEYIDYGFRNRDVRWKAGVGLTYYPMRFVRTFVRFGDYYEMINSYASLTSAFSRSNYVRTREFSISQRMEIANGLFGEFTFEFSDQAPITNMHLEQWSQLLFDSLNTPTDFQRYIKTEIRFELKYRFRQKYIIKQNKKIIIGTKYPEIRFFYRKGIPRLMNSEINFDYMELGSKDDIRIGRFGYSTWNVMVGAFLNKKGLRLLEHKYFRGSDAGFFSDPTNSFQLLGYTMSTANSFLRINYIHHFEGAFGSKIPWVGRLGFMMAAGGGVLMIPDQNFRHGEIFLGLEHNFRIKKQLFRFGFYAVTADNTLDKANIKFKFGISYYNSFSRKWSY